MSILHRTALLTIKPVPLTHRHLRYINELVAQYQTLHIVVITGDDDVSSPSQQTMARWLQVSCQSFGFVSIWTLHQLGLTTPTAQEMLHAIGIDEASVLTMPDYPPAGFDELALACRYFYATKIAIVGGESSGKTTLLHKLANHYGSAIALEMGRLYTHSHLGGTEAGLQYSDYPTIAINHAQAIENACHHTCCPVVLIDTDFVTTQAFCQTYEQKTHPLLDAFIHQYHPNSDDPHRINHTIYLENNVAWVADGMRRLGGNHRSVFAQTLLHLYDQHQIPVHRIDSPDYHGRYLQAVAIIDKIRSF